MNIGNLKKILDMGLPEAITRNYILAEIARDKEAVNDVLEMLAYEREEKKELILDLNLLLSKAHTGLENPKLNKDGFMQKEIGEFYDQGRIGHCFRNKNKETHSITK